MKDKILRFARGDFSEVQSNIVMSENQISLDVEEGRVRHGSFYIGNESGVHMKGLLYSECPHLTLKEKIHIHGLYTFMQKYPEVSNAEIYQTIKGHPLKFWLLKREAVSLSFKRV